MALHSRPSITDAVFPSCLPRAATLSSRIFPAPQIQAILPPLWLTTLSEPTCPLTCSSINILLSAISPPTSFLIIQPMIISPACELQTHFLPLFKNHPFCLVFSVFLNSAYTSSPELACKLPEDRALSSDHPIIPAKHPEQNGLPGLDKASFTQLFMLSGRFWAGASWAWSSPTEQQGGLLEWKARDQESKLACHWTGM